MCDSNSNQVKDILVEGLVSVRGRFNSYNVVSHRINDHWLGFSILPRYFMSNHLNDWGRRTEYFITFWFCFERIWVLNRNKIGKSSSFSFLPVGSMTRFKARTTTERLNICTFFFSLFLSFKKVRNDSQKTNMKIFGI